VSRTPHRVGQAVMRTRDGQIGIITEPLRKSGPNKGKLAVIFVDYDWEISVEPDEVEVIDIVRAPDDEDDDTMPAPVSGDLCHFLPGGTMVEHYRCDDYRDGTITNCITGETVQDAPYTAPRGFVRATPVAEPTNGGE